LKRTKSQYALRCDLPLKTAYFFKASRYQFILRLPELPVVSEQAGVGAIRECPTPGNNKCSDAIGGNCRFRSRDEHPDNAQDKKPPGEPAGPEHK
jgi:hypothetical protein